MRESGRVVSKKGDILTVTFARKDACKMCGACKFDADGITTLELKDTLGANIGDVVEIEIIENRLLKASMITYGIPLVFFLLGLYAGDMIGKILFNGNTALPIIVSSLTFTALSYIIVRVHDKKKSKTGYYLPVIVSIRADGKEEE